MAEPSRFPVEASETEYRVLRPDGRADWLAFNKILQSRRPELDLNSRESAFNELLRICNIARNAGRKVVAADIIPVLEDQLGPDA